MGSLSVWHWLIVLVIVVLVFGTGKLKNMGKDLGGAIRGFKEILEGKHDDLPESAFLFVGTIDEAVEKAKQGAAK